MIDLCNFLQTFHQYRTLLATQNIQLARQHITVSYPAHHSQLPSKSTSQSVLTQHITLRYPRHHNQLILDPVVMLKSKTVEMLRQSRC